MTIYFKYPHKLLQEELSNIAKNITIPGRGILGTFDSEASLGKRFEEVGCENTEDMRRKYRQLLYTAEPNLNEYISGISMSHEAVYQKSDKGVRFVDLLKKIGILVGIKLDTGFQELMGSKNEITTQGLQNLAQRCAKYKEDGCDFAIWRCCFKIGLNSPSFQAIAENANVMGRFASICQSERLVPVIEPEVLFEGEHDIDRCAKVTEVILAAIVKALSDHHVFLEGIILSPTMVTQGRQCENRVSPLELGQITVKILRRTVPAAVPGILFISGGQNEENASLHLNAINQVQMMRPWSLSFSFNRAMLNSVLRIWSCKDQNIRAAQDQLLIRAKANSEASIGRYEGAKNPCCTACKIKKR